MEYQVVYLDRNFRLSHDETQTPLLETDNLAEACTFAHNLFLKEKKDCATYQPRTEGYRSVHTNPRRKKNGQFSKFEHDNS